MTVSNLISKRTRLPLLLVSLLLSWSSGQVQHPPRKTSSRIVGGSVVTNIDRFSYFAVVNILWTDTDGTDIKKTCGGALVSSKVVLTAAHCLYDIDIKSISVSLGVKEMDDNSSEMTTISATSWKLNPSFNKRSVLDDIGMIRLSRPAPGLFKPIAVRFSEGFPKQGKWTKVMGFGYTSGNGPRSNKLRQISLQVRKSKDCDRIFSSFNNARQICAGEDGKVPCLGDSGGPMIVVDSNGRHVLAGIVSYGERGCDDKPAVFTRVSAFESWIKDSVCEGTGSLPSWCKVSKAPPPSMCFAGKNTVEVQGRGPIRMYDLKIGDHVKVENGNFEPIYSFGHYAPSAVATFLRIRTTRSTFILTENHMVFTSSKIAVPASALQVGQVLQDASGSKDRVESIDIVQDLGLFAPFTLSGKLVVNNTLVSSYVALLDLDDLGHGLRHLDQHWLNHGALFPHRLLCYYLGLCPPESYNTEGIACWAEYLLRTFSWLLKCQGLPRVAVIVLMSAVVSIMSVLETWIWLMPFLLAIVAFAPRRISVRSRFTRKGKEC